MGEIIINIDGNSLQMIEAGHSYKSADDSCELYRGNLTIIVYIEDGVTFKDATKLYKDEFGLEFAESGFYTFDGLTRYWDYELQEFTSTKGCG